MSTVGIIAEFNPLHTGHYYLLNKARELGTVVAVISGNFVQRGDIAVAEKRVRAAAALRCGADAVLELPVSYSLSTAQNFALGGISALYAAGCDTVMFGSECGDINELLTAADALSTDEYRTWLSEYLATGMTFAAARERAAGLKNGILSYPNNNLAVEYILAARSIGADFKFVTVPRVGQAHDSMETGEFVSASLLRQKLLCGDYDFCKKYIPKEAESLFVGENFADMRRIETAVLSVLRLKTENELKNLPDISEGIENKLFSAIKLATSLDELYNTVKVKRYTHARIRRLALSAFIGLDNALFMKIPPYIRVLGFNKNGEEHLKKQLNSSFIPLVMRVSDIKNLSDAANLMFAAECRAADLYSLALPKALPCGSEYTAKIIKTE
ncbi:MAG: nucleotidyltransferase family protein [Acutalibacteraceae bacterium]|nr:nucleotidyltransferase family protein [Acutalibacteraceae bacterium]